MTVTNVKTKSIAGSNRRYNSLGGAFINAGNVNRGLCVFVSAKIITSLSIRLGLGSGGLSIAWPGSSTGGGGLS